METCTEPRTVTRQQLYELVWSTPMTRLAKSFGLSDVGLAKICDRHDIPKPAAGHWAKKAFGKAEPQPPLPPCSDSALTTITITPISQHRANKSSEPQSVAYVFFDAELGRLAEAEGRCENQVIVSRSLHSPHPLVIRTREGLVAASKERRYGNDPLLFPHRADNLRCLDVRVGQPSIERAMRIMDALIKGLEQRGYQITILDTDWHRGTTIEGPGRTFQIRLRESTLRLKHEATPEERKHLEKYPGSWSVPKYDNVLSGKLHLDLLNEGGGSAISSLRDGKMRKVEDLLATFPLILLRELDQRRHQAAALAEESRKRAEVERQRREEEERRRLAEQRRKEEEARMESLFTEAETWARCRRLREYLQAVREMANDRYGFIERGSEMDQWLIWAEGVANRFDPLSPPEGSAPEPEAPQTSAGVALPNLPR